ncbi:hypothetical protein [Prochlorococcus sp. MIT 1011]|uniref:hypothetical protein n=1 Tax=Prochlorococcus sp. MIT 1011 TaxID=3082520 RepID=UPI0039B3C9A3
MNSPEIQKEGKKIRQELMEKEAKDARDQGILVSFGCLGSFVLVIVLGLVFLTGKNTDDTNSEDQSTIISSELVRKV